ncbi:MAG: phenylacetate--CoA ligase family protein [bacterium]
MPARHSPFAELARAPQAVRIYRDLLGAVHLTPPALRERRRRRLAALLRHAFDTVPFYHRRFAEAGLRPEDIGEEEGLARLPLTSKEELRVLPLSEVISSRVRPEQLAPHTTSGSTGTPFTFYRTPETHLFHVLAHLRPMVLLGMTWRDRLLSLGRLAYLVDTWPQRLGLLPTVILSPLAPLPRQLEVLSRFRPTVLAAYPSGVRALATAVLEGRMPRPRPRLLFTGGEHTDEATRGLLERAFGVPPLSLYGMLEVARIGWQCRPGSPFHTSDDYLILEIVRDGRPVREGEVGELVVTHLTKTDMPWIRYRTGDLVRRVPRACGCTHALGQIDLVGGRVSEVLLLPDGTLRSALRVTSTIHRVTGILQYQLRQEEVGAVVLRVVAGPGFDADTPLRLRRAFEPLLPGMTVRVEQVAEIPRTPGGKAAYVHVAPAVREKIAGIGAKVLRP